MAREGCVDETLSAIAAAMESKELSHAIEHGLHYVEKYAGLDEPTATWIRDELNTIAIEESSHSALTMRTLCCVCRVDSEACNVATREVLDESQLELRINYRFASSFEGQPESLAEMKKEWRNVYGALLTNVSLDESQLEMDYLLCSEANKKKETDDGNAILRELTDNALRGVLCEANHASQGVRL